MPSASRPVFLRTFGRALSKRRGPELADMGTAFALDYSLDQAPLVEPLFGPGEPGKAKPSAWRRWFGRKSGA